jgi:hypothetical protein
MRLVFFRREINEQEEIVDNCLRIRSVGRLRR